MSGSVPSGSEQFDLAYLHQWPSDMALHARPGTSFHNPCSLISASRSVINFGHVNRNMLQFSEQGQEMYVCMYSKPCSNSKSQLQ